MRPRRAASLTFLFQVAWLAGCQSGAPPDASTTAAPELDADAPAIPPLELAEAVHLPGLHNVVTYADGLCSGAVPVGDEGFATLAAMGVRTVVSVDGATPAVDLAHRHGLRYVHLPISYDGVPDDRALQLGQVLANAEGPIYVHCHHGKHRSAAALATGAIVAGRLQPAEAEARMHVSGTSSSYPGLWAAARTAAAAPPDRLIAAVDEFPEVAEVSGLVALMAEADVVFDLVKSAEAAAWQVPADHPDLVPANETARMHRLFERLQQDAESTALPADYQQQLGEFLELAAGLDAAVRAGDADTASTRFAALGESCKQCHRSYRDR